MVKNPPARAADVRDVGLIPGSTEDPLEKEWQPTSVFLPGQFHSQRSLVGYCPWGHKESDTTEQLSTQTLMTQLPFLYCQDSLGSSDINPTQQRSSVSLCASVSVSFCFTVSLTLFSCFCFSLLCYFRQIFLHVVEIMDAGNTWLLSFHVHCPQSPKQGHIS